MTDIQKEAGAANTVSGLTRHKLAGKGGATAPLSQVGHYDEHCPQQHGGRTI